ncbi:lamin tail domain-containing protein, partial [bacterium]|nr:lamin tail domain-containing protein [bacterium]
MSNPLGAWSAIPGDDSNEFIEIYNAGTDSVDLAGWIIYDGDDDDLLTSAADGMAILPSDSDGIYTSTILAPGCFALILDPEYTDAANDQPYDWPSNTLILTISTTTDLGGSRLSDDDPVYLITPSADTVDFYPASVTPIEGKSVERVGWDEESGWAISIASAGCTAGSRNSVWPYPHDLCLDSLAVAENPVETSPANVTAFIRNSGETVFSDGIVYLFDGIDE